MHQRTTLNARENSLVELLAKLLILAENQTATRTAESLMSSSSNYISIWNWAWMQAGSYQTSNMSHIHHEICTYRVGNLSHTLEINSSSIGRGTSYDQLWLALIGNSLNLIIIQHLGLFANTIWHDFEVFTRHINR